MRLLLLILFAGLFPVAHLVNGWIFRFAEITPNIGLVYLPAFLRLSNVLILGPLHGTLATLLGSMMLFWHFDLTLWDALPTALCSAGGPLVALYFFKWHARRPVDLTSLKDLAELTVIYAVSNAVLHHATWSLLDPSKLDEPTQVLWMIVGDILGALLGAYLMKWGIVWYRKRQLAKDLLD